MPESKQEEVFAFIVEMLHVKPHKISLEKSINFDLGMDGDDAVEFFEAFEVRFSADLKALGEEWDSYFGPEGGFAMAALFALTSLSPSSRFKKRPLPVSRIVHAAEVGRWEKLIY